MAKAPPPQRFPIPLPLNGLDRSPAFVAQAAGTYAAGLNVSSVDSADRKRIGKRAGHTRLFTTRAGSTSARRILGLLPMTLATGVIASQSASLEVIEEDWGDYTASSTPDFLGDYVFFQRAPTSASNSPPTTEPVLTATPVVQLQGNGSSRCWLSPNYRTTNDMLIRVIGSADTSTGTNNLATAYRVAVRMSDDCTDWIQAGLETNGTNLVRVRVEKQVGATLSLIGFSANLSLTTATVTESTDLTIRAFATATGITVQITWPTKTADDPLWAGFEYTVANTDLVGNERAGVAGAPGAFSSIDSIIEMRYVRRVPAAADVVNELLGTDTESPLTDQYIVPTGWAAFSTTNVGVVTSATGPVGSATAIGAGRNYPAVDTTNLRLDGGDSSTVSKCLLPTAAVPADETHGIEVRYPDNDASGNNFSAFFRVLDNFTGALKLLMTRTNAYSAGTRLGSFSTAGNLVPYAVVSGVITSLAASERMNCPFHTRTHLRISASATTLTISQNGMTLYSFTYSSVAAWTSSGASTALASATRVGAGPLGATTDGGFGFRIVQTGSSASTAVGDFTNRILVLTEGLAHIGRLDDPDSLEVVTGTGTFNALPSGFNFNSKWYVVDGGVSKIIDPATNTAEDWLATEGTFPSGCRLAALYRGCGFLARTTENPSIWFKTRALELTDFDIGSDPVETSAAAGTDPDIGLPGDAIVALVSFNDDLLFFLCATSIYVLEGDPGYGGAIQNVSTEAGCVGSRAWCFDDKGNLYFFGPKGIYKVMRGTRDIGNPIDGGRVPAYLDNLDLDSNLVQLTFDKNTGDLTVWITPTDGSNGYHIRINTETLHIHPLELDADLGPWAVCAITGVEDLDRRYLIGGDDGYIRRPDDAAKADDADANGTAFSIDSWFEVGPFQVDGGDVETIINDLNCYLSANTTEAVSWYWFVGSSPEAVAAQDWSEAVATGTWGPTTGFQQPTGLRQSGAAHKLRIRQTSATGDYSIEQMWGHMQRRRGRR